MGMFSPETEALRQRLAQQMTHATGQSGGEWIQAKQRMNLLPPWYQTLSGERTGQGFTEALQAINQNRGDMQIGDTSINPIDFVNPVAGIFGGKLAKTADLMALREAMNRASAGDDAQKIWQETGWFKSPDGQWRFEIDDSAASFVSPQRLQLAQEELSRRGFQLGNPKTPDFEQAAALGYADNKLDNLRVNDAVTHSDLFSAYPDTARMRLERYVPDGQSAGYARDNAIGVAYPRTGEHSGHQLSTTLHELQHAIQQREGFARGGSPGGMKREAAELKITLDDLMRQRGDMEAAALRKAGLSEYGYSPEQAAVRLEVQQSPEYLALLDETRRIGDQYDLMKSFDDYGMDAYSRLAGEAEARAVQSRMNLTPEQRRMRFPLDDYDVPVDELIMRYGDGPAMSQMDDIITRQRAAEGLRAAIRDPETGKIYIAGTHQAAIEKAPAWDRDPNPGTWGRLSAEWDQATENVGFVDRNGKFLSRDETERQMGVSTVEDVRELLWGRYRR